MVDRGVLVSLGFRTAWLRNLFGMINYDDRSRRAFFQHKINMSTAHNKK
jgi:hypothetical protein